MLRLGVGQIINHCRAFKSGSVYSASGSIHKAMAHINISWAATRINMSTMISKTTLKPQKVLSLTSVQLPKGAEKKVEKIQRAPKRIIAHQRTMHIQPLKLLETIYLQIDS